MAREGGGLAPAEAERFRTLSHDRNRPQWTLFGLIHAALTLHSPPSKLNGDRSPSETLLDVLHHEGGLVVVALLEGLGPTLAEALEQQKGVVAGLPAGSVHELLQEWG